MYKMHSYDHNNLTRFITEDQAVFIKSVAMLKRNALAAPFERAFAEQKALENTPAPTDGSPREQGQLMQIHYRDEEAIYVRASHDRVTVVFSTIFKEETDRIFGKVFLQEFVDAPQVLYSNRDPPLEIRHIPGLKNTEDVGYVTFGALIFDSLTLQCLDILIILLPLSSLPPPLLCPHGRRDHLTHSALP
jgi:hypothetical protein